MAKNRMPVPLPVEACASVPEMSGRILVRIEEAFGFGCSDEVYRILDAEIDYAASYVAQCSPIDLPRMLVLRAVNVTGKWRASASCAA